ncbi:MAG: diacylglycerol kinase family protein [Leptolyngbyaceae cyanobacterium SL_7_1]|nr:diacylglycerol kinase family protein [Leptolyngbyaceae cyanobacterium SL_7_1]
MNEPVSLYNSSAGRDSSPAYLLTPEASEPSPSSILTQPNRELAWQVATSLAVSFKYAWAGVKYAFQTQRNFRIHVCVGTLAIFLSFILSLTSIEVAVVCLTIGAVLTMELLNTAIESVVDLTVKQSYHELAKIAKDCAAGAVLISSIAAILVASTLILPPLVYAIIHAIETSPF